VPSLFHSRRPQMVVFGNSSEMIFSIFSAPFNRMITLPAEIAKFMLKKF
jgi:hypothetical protein